MLKRRTITSLLLLAIGITAATGQEKLDKAAVEKIVRGYLLEHPEILIEMSQKLQTMQAANKKQQAQSALSAHRNDLVADPKSPAVGPSLSVKGVVTVVEFFDFHCGYCKKVNPVLEKMMAENPNVRVVFKQYPILGDDSSVAAHAALAAAKQGDYLKFHNALLASASLSMASIEQIAKDQGLDVARLKKDMASEEVESEITRSAALADALAIEATPSFVIGNELIQGALDEAGFKRLIAKARAESAVAPTPGGGN